MGFEANAVDPCVMNKIIDGKQCTILIYVDDLLLSCASESAIQSVIDSLKQEFGGDVKASSDKDLSYLGMHLKLESGKITVSMVSYLSTLLNEFGVSGSVTTPATSNLFKVDKHR